MQVASQFIKYALVGIVSNLLLYGAYLLMTAFGLAPKLAMTMLYVWGVLQTFVVNRSWTFGYTGSASAALWKYALAYLSGYFINLIALYAFVDLLGLYHAYVQGVAIITIAIYLFTLQKYVIFNRGEER